MWAGWLLLLFQTVFVLATEPPQEFSPAPTDSLVPSSAPTADSLGPSSAPTANSLEPTPAPSLSSLEPTLEPTSAPSSEPTSAPSSEPTPAPSLLSSEPTPASSLKPTSAFSSRPTVSPSPSASLGALNPQYLVAGLIALAVLFCFLCVALICEHRKKHEPIEVRDDEEEMKSAPPSSHRMIYDDKIGLGLSGGGVRSAAFVSGVLWGLINLIPAEDDNRDDDIFEGGKTILLPQGHMPKFISCVSGGGYVGSSFTYWSRIKKGADPREWSEQYFERMRKGIGYYCDFTSLFRGIRDVCVTSIMLASLIALSVLIILPVTYVFGEFILLPYSAYYNAFGDFPSCLTRNITNYCKNDQNGVFSTIDSNVEVQNMSGNFVNTRGRFESMNGTFRSMSGFFHSESLSGAFLDLNGDPINITAYSIPNLTGYSIINLSGSFQSLSADFLNLSGSFKEVSGGFEDLAGSYTDLFGFKETGAGGARGGTSEWNNDVIWLVFVICASGLPVFSALAWLVDWKSEEELRKIYLGESTRKQHLRGWKTFAEMLSHLNYSVASFLLLFVMVVFFDFGVRDDDSEAEPLETTTVVLWALRLMIMYLMFRRSVGLIPLFLQGQILIWIYWDPHKFLWSSRDKSFDDHYQLFAILSKVLIPFMSLLSLLRERMVFEFSRWRLARAFYDAPGSHFTLRYLQRAPAIGKMMWTPPKYGEYPTYIACTTVNGWMVIPPEGVLYNPIAIEKEHELNFWYEHLKDEDKARIDGILSDAAVSHIVADSSPSPSADTRSIMQSVTSGLRRKTTVKQAQKEVSNEVLDRAIGAAREIVLRDPTMADKVSYFESTKASRAKALAQNLRELAWSNSQAPNSSYDILAMTTEGWWERYEDGTAAPLQIYAQGKDRSINDDAIVGANSDVLLSEAMCMSAAAGSFLNGEYGELRRAEERTQVMFGLHMGRWVETSVKRGASGIMTMLILGSIIGAPVVILGGITDPFKRTEMYDSGTNNGQYSEYIGGALTVLFFVVWCTLLPLFSHYFPRIHPFLPRARDMMTLSGVVAWSHSIPSMLYLSDGGHTENLGLCPLLARRLRYMVVACGAQDEVCGALRSALEQSRKKLGCRFRPVRADQHRRRVNRVTSDPELDLLSDIEFFARDDARVMVIEVMYRSQRRTWRSTSRGIASGSEINANDKGYIFYVKPIAIHPKGFPESSDTTERDEPYGAKCVTRLHRRHEPLAGCCCAGCHRCGCFTSISGKFPFHSTAFQFFTVPLFDAYHAQGVQAMKDAFKVKLPADQSHHFSFDRSYSSWWSAEMASKVPRVLDGQKKSN